MAKKNIEKRIYKAELRAAGNDSNTLEGYAALYNSDSEDLGGFIERIAPGAFDNADSTDAIVFFDHRGMPLGRTRSGTATVTADEKGLFVRCDLPDTTHAKDLKVLMERGDVDQMSFAFTIPKGGDIVTRENGRTLRTITEIDHIYDVSVVSMPAYPETSVALRSIDSALKETENNTAAVKAAERKRQLLLAD